MTDETKLEKLRQSVTGMKTQQSFLRERVTKLEFRVKLLELSWAIYCGIIIIGYITR